MSAKILAIADAVTAALNAHTFRQAFTAVRTMAPILELQNLGQLYVAVVPADWRTESIADLTTQYELTIQVHVLQKLDAEDNAALDPLVDLVDEIREFLLGEYVDTNASCNQANVSPEPDDLYVLRQFTAVIEATYQVIA